MYCDTCLVELMYCMGLRNQFRAKNYLLKFQMHSDILYEYRLKQFEARLGTKRGQGFRSVAL